MNETEKVLDWICELLRDAEEYRNTYEDFCGTGDLTEEERKEVYDDMEHHIKKFIIIKSALEKQIQNPIKFDENDLNTCPVCKSNVLTDDKFCKECGQSIYLDFTSIN